MFAEKKDKRRAERDSCDESKYKCDESKRRGNPEEHIYDPGSFVVQDFHK